MEYLSYQSDQPPAPCLKPESVQLSDPDTGRLLVAPESERPEPNCPLQITENTPTGDRYQGQPSTRDKWDQHGVCTTGLYTFADGLSFSDQNWKYCQYPDRRYWSEIQFGIGRRDAPSSPTATTTTRPSTCQRACLTPVDGVYDPKCRTVYDYGDRARSSAS
ncbi:MORN repeat-containing protein 5 [Amphibalanus amphitrite]|uniref:MORN repeat-containing protein 5 n=1 Tax=Amphibalanus amphitrite TaxID=1232801 RepID=A0A6A4WPG9_AMPAM|nr:MORN repeat-containing protein 5 [Amphibalanus amphitrite]